ncbi:MAG: F0F1 ATP synthase subunit delta [Gemmatimonadota bacterium]
MRETTIARNYAEAYLALARKAGDLDGFGAMLNAVAGAMEREPRLQNFLAAPQIPAPDKSALLARALGDVVPRVVLRFLQKLIDNRRQLLIPLISVEYGNLVDESEGRVHAHVTVAKQGTERDYQEIGRRLTERLGMKVVPHIQVNPSILGGVVVRVGETVMDGSVRRRLSTLRSRLTSGR